MMWDIIMTWENNIAHGTNFCTKRDGHGWVVVKTVQNSEEVALFRIFSIWWMYILFISLTKNSYHLAVFQFNSQSLTHHIEKDRCNWIFAITIPVSHCASFIVRELLHWHVSRAVIHEKTMGKGILQVELKIFI